MRILVAGATGALGVPLVRHLIADGHEVTGLSRTGRRTSTLAGLGARVVTANVLDAEALSRAVRTARPEMVVHALTAIPPAGPRRLADLDATNALRVDGTRNLLAAAGAAGARRIVVESMVFVYGFGDLGDTLLTEEASPARVVSKPALRVVIDALISEERQTLEASRSGRIEASVLRFGCFYGPDAGTDTMARHLVRRALPIVKRAPSRGIAWIHIHDAASAVVTALENAQPGAVYNIVDDEAVTARGMIESLAQSIGAPTPWSIPAWLMRAVAPFAAAVCVDTTLKVSNAKAKQELTWRPRFPTYREGIRHYRGVPSEELKLRRPNQTRESFSSLAECDQFIEVGCCVSGWVRSSVAVP